MGFLEIPPLREKIGDKQNIALHVSKAAAMPRISIEV